MSSQNAPIVIVAALALLALGLLLGWLLARTRAAAEVGRARTELARAEGEARVLRSDLAALTDARDHDLRTAAELGPLRSTLARVERQVATLERDRVEQFGEVGAHLEQVAAQTRALRDQTSALTGALNASGVRGTWGEVQLRRVLEHAGMLERCDFDEQVSATTRHDARVRPDVVVHLPGGKSLVVDSKAPLAAFLRAQSDTIGPDEADRLVAEHARALRRHVDGLAAKDYWSAFTTTPELVVCFVPSDAVLAAALRAEPDLFDHAQAAKVVLAAPSTLLTLLRATALVWQQDALTEGARELLALGTELHRRLATLGRHITSMGTQLRRSVETYNQLVGTLESRVMVTSRRIHELGLADEPLPTLPSVEVAPRPLTAPELLDQELSALPTRPLLDVDQAPETWGAAPGRRIG